MYIKLHCIDHLMEEYFDYGRRAAKTVRRLGVDTQMSIGDARNIFICSYNQLIPPAVWSWLKVSSSENASKRMRVFSKTSSHGALIMPS
jgi:hypothetical protein